MWGSRTGGWLMVALLTAQTSAALASPATGKAASKRAPATVVHAATAAASDDESDKLYVSEPKPVRSVLHDPEILSRDEKLALARKNAPIFRSLSSTVSASARSRFASATRSSSRAFRITCST